MGYLLETILAEKTAASVELGTANTRQKDFYDLYQMSLLEGLEAGGVRQAFERTFASRGLDLNSALSVLEGVSLARTAARGRGAGKLAARKGELGRVVRLLETPHPVQSRRVKLEGCPTPPLEVCPKANGLPWSY